MTSTKGTIHSADELALWRRFQSGDTVAWERLMVLNFGVLYRYGTKFCRDEEFIKDCIQDLFLDIWERRGSLSDTIVVKAYLMASLRRRIHRAIESTKWVLDEPVESDTTLFDAEFSVEESLIQKETTQALAYEIQMQLEQLPKRQKEAVYLKFFEELSRDQIAEVMGVHPQSVSNLLQAAFKELKSNWKVDFFLLVMLNFLC